jgi:hypothetical protein
MKKVLLLAFVFLIGSPLFSQWKEHMFEYNISSRHMVLEREDGTRFFITNQTYQEVEGKEHKTRPFYLLGMITADPSYFMDMIDLMFYENGEEVEIQKITLKQKGFPLRDAALDYAEAEILEAEAFLKKASDVFYKFRWADPKEYTVEIMGKDGETRILSLSKKDFSNIGDLAEFYQSYRRSSGSPKGMTQPYVYEINTGRQ